MACSCTDALDDLSAKFDLILELVNTVLGMLAARVSPRIAVGGGPPAEPDYREIEFIRMLQEQREFDEIMDIIAILDAAGII